MLFSVATLERETKRLESGRGKCDPALDQTGLNWTLWTLTLVLA